MYGVNELCPCTLQYSVLLLRSNNIYLNAWFRNFYSTSWLTSVTGLTGYELIKGHLMNMYGIEVNELCLCRLQCSVLLLRSNSIILKGIVQKFPFIIMADNIAMGMRFYTQHVKVHYMNMYINRGQGTVSLQIVYCSISWRVSSLFKSRLYMYTDIERTLWLRMTPYKSVK